MDIYLTIYRGETAEDEVEINVYGVYHEDWDDLEVVTVTDTYTEQPIELTPDELKLVHGDELNEFLESQERYDLVERRGEP